MANKIEEIKAKLEQAGVHMDGGGGHVSITDGDYMALGYSHDGGRIGDFEFSTDLFVFGASHDEVRTETTGKGAHINCTSKSVMAGVGIIQNISHSVKNIDASLGVSVGYKFQVSDECNANFNYSAQQTPAREQGTVNFGVTARW